jgi:hypothetical protein
MSASLAAQSFVSPAIATNAPGNAANGLPVCDDAPRARRYQQVHEAVPPMPIRSIAFRPNESAFTFQGTNVLDLEVWMGPGNPLAQTSHFFDRNFRLQPTLVLPRTRISIAAQGTPGWPGPTPFSLPLVLQNPYGHTGGPIVWELRIHSSSYNGSPSMAFYDAERGSMAASDGTRIGEGCWVAGRGAFQLLHTGGCVDSGGVLQWNFQVSAAPSSTPVYVSIGTQNPNAPFGCSRLFTNLALILPIGTSDANGAITNHQAGAATLVLPNPVAPNSLGPLVYAQAHALTGNTLVNSSGMEFRLPAPLLTRRVEVARIFNHQGGVGAAEGVWPVDASLPYSFVGYGLVTEFR